MRLRKTRRDCYVASDYPHIFSAGDRATLDLATKFVCNCLLGRVEAKDGSMARTTCKQASTWFPSCRSITYPEVRGRRHDKTSLGSMRQVILRGRNIGVADTPTVGSTCRLQK